MWLATGSYSGKSPSVTQPGPASACVCQCCWRSWEAVACNSLANAVLSQVEGAERNIARLVLGQGEQMRIAVECHTCFDRLMPAMDAFRTRWPEVELDIVSGFHGDPVGLLHQGRADEAIVSAVDADETGVDYHALFGFEIRALLANTHPLVAKPHLVAQDFADQTIITYPVPDEMLDLIRQVLEPAGVRPPRRTTELTVAMLQLVASGRGVAALPPWAVQSYLDRGYVTARPVGKRPARRAARRVPAQPVGQAVSAGLCSGDARDELCDAQGRRTFVA